MERLLGLHVGVQVLGLGRVVFALLLEVADEPLQGVLAAVEDEVVRQLALPPRGFPHTG